MLLPCLFFASWAGSAYNNEIHNLLDADGIRWVITHILSCYSKLPLAFIILLLVTLSIMFESGWVGWIFPKNHPLMLKQLRAHTYTNLLALFLFAIFIFVMLIPGSPLLNVFGGFEHSPLSKGWGVLLLLFFILLSNVYGFISGQLTTLNDFAKAHTLLLRKYAYAFLTLFSVSQICGCLDYSNLLTFVSDSTETIIMYILIALCFV